jgi:hypothetical protein
MSQYLQVTKIELMPNKFMNMDNGATDWWFQVHFHVIATFIAVVQYNFHLILKMIRTDTKYIHLAPASDVNL